MPMAQGPGPGGNQQPIEELSKIEDARASLRRVLQENEQLEEELVRVRGGNLRAAQILAAPLLQPESPDRGGGDGGHRPPAVATAPEGSPSVPPQTPPPPDTVPPKRPRPDDD